MEVIEARKVRAELGMKVMELVKNFETNTGLYVTNLDMLRSKKVSQEPSNPGDLVFVVVEVKL